MEVTFRPKNFKLAPDIESHIRKRIERLPRHLDHLEAAEVSLAQQPTHLNPQRLQYVAQLTLRTRNNLIRSEVAHSELLTAVDQAVDHLSRQIERYKGRYYRRRKGSSGLGKSSAEMASIMPLPEAPSVVEMAAAAELEDSLMPTVSSNSNASADIDESEAGEIVRVKRFNVQPMFPEEAVEQMELLGHTFFIFWNAGEERMNVIYRRNDGNYGLLQPELS